MTTTTQLTGTLSRLSAALLLIALPATVARAAEAARTVEAASPSMPAADAFFEPNVGQAPSGVRFLSRGASQNVLVTGEGLWFGGQDGARVGLELVGGAKIHAKGADPLPGTSNYQVGSDPSHWHAEVPHFGRIVAPSVYPGIDLVAYAHGRDLEYDLRLAAGSDPRLLRLRFVGARHVRIDGAGNLLIETPSGIVHHGKPVAYQISDDGRSSRQLVGARYRLGRDGSVVFALDGYDRRRALVIDPVLSTTKRFGGSGNEQVTDIAVDGSGNVYATGYTDGHGFPIVNGSQTSLRGDVDAFVSKFNASGTLVYSTYYGGNREDVGRAITIDGSGRAVVVGTTKSDNLTIVRGFQTSASAGVGSFLLILSSAGNSVFYSSYLGGTAAGAEVRAWDVASTVDGNVWLTGQATATKLTFTPRGFQPTHGGGTTDAFVMSVNPNASSTSSIVGFSYFGGSGDDVGRRIIRRGADVLVGGDTYSGSDLHVSKTFTPFGQSDAFVLTVISPFSYGGSIRFGGSDDERVRGIGLDSNNNIYVSGESQSSDLPVTGMVSQKQLVSSPNVDRADVFVAKLNSGATSIVYLTYLGGHNVDWNTDLAVTTSGTVYVTGTTYSDNFPTVPAMQVPDQRNGFLAKLDTNGALVFSTLLGGRDVDDSVAVALSGSTLWVGGSSRSFTFPGAGGALGLWDALVTKFTLP